MLRRLSGYEAFAPLLLRVGIGLTFLLAGLGKVLGGTDGVAGFFGSLGIPLPGLMGPLIAYLELLGGLALIIGLLTRVFSLLFVANMLVAIVLVSGPAMFGAENAVMGFTETRTEVLLLLGSLALALLGPGALAVDNALLGERTEVRSLSERSRTLG